MFAAQPSYAYRSDFVFHFSFSVVDRPRLGNNKWHQSEVGVRSILGAGGVRSAGEMAGSGDETGKELEEKRAVAEAAALQKPLARLTADEGSDLRVVERVVHSGGSGGMPPIMLTRTNYTMAAGRRTLAGGGDRRADNPRGPARHGCHAQRCATS